MMVTAEIGVNWRTDEEFLDLARKSVEAGASIVKGQYFRLRDIQYHKDARRLRPLAMTLSRAARLTETLLEEDVRLYWTPETPMDVLDCLALNPSWLKVSHTGAISRGMMRRVTESILPNTVLFVSVEPKRGCDCPPGVEWNAALIGRHPPKVLYCRGQYPTPSTVHYGDVKRGLSGFSGFSCHTLNVGAIHLVHQTLLAEGENLYFEFHVRPDNSKKYIDDAVSFRPEELKGLLARLEDKE